MARINGNIINGYWQGYLEYTIDSDTDPYNYKITWSTGLHIVKGYSSNLVTWSVSSTNQTTQSGTKSGGTGSTTANTDVLIKSNQTYSWTKTKATQNIELSFSIKTAGTIAGGTSTGNVSITIPTIPSYTVSYNANGGTSSSIPDSQTKWHGENLTLSSTVPTKTGAIFKGWATSSSGTVAYQPNSVYTLNDDIILYAIWETAHYTITYNANGGSGSATQIKTWGIYVKVLSAQEAKNRGIIKSGNSIGSWNTKANGSGTTYSATGNAQYQNNASVTLYAQWVLNYIKPIVNNVSAYRVTTAGGTTRSDTGEYIRVTFNYTGGTINSGQSYLSPNINIYIDNNETAVYSGQGTNTAGASFAQTIGDTNNTYDVNTSHSITIKLDCTGYTDSTEITSVTTTVPSAVFPIDILGDGSAMGLMHPAVNQQILTLPNNTIVDGNINATSLNGTTIPNPLSFTDTKVTISAVTPSSATNYYLAFKNSVSGTAGLNANLYTRVQILEGTTTESGKSQLLLGNGVASGTAGNSRGIISLYNINKGYTSLSCVSSPNNYSITFPAKSGTVAIPTAIIAGQSYARGTSFASDYTVTKTITISGAGFITLSASTICEEDYSDTGTWYIGISDNSGTLRAGSGGRFTSAITPAIGGTATVNLAVSDGDILTVKIMNSKTSAKRWDITGLCFNCTATIT